MKTIAGAMGAFQRNGFDARAFERAEQVAEAMAAELTDICSVGFGGSATLRQLHLDQVIAATDTIFFDHWQEGLNKADVWNQRLDQGRADLFVTSANAATMTGKLVLIDGVGNRAAASIFGPKRVIFIIGENKLVSDLDAGMQRIKEISAPRRAKELGVDTPCAKSGRCMDCHSPQRICRCTLIVERPSMGMTAAVWIVRGEWGL